jgi:protein-disulfide isomerase
MNANSKNLLWGVGTFLIILVGLWGVWHLTTAPATSNTPEKAQEITLTPTDNIQGPETAIVTLVEYSDLQCPACRSYHPVVKQLLQKYPKELRLVYRHFPLEIHQHALEAAYAAEAAHKQGKFFEYHDLVFENQADWEQAKKATPIFLKYAKELKLNEKQFAADMKSKEVKDRVEADKKSGMGLAVNSTPTFYVNGVKIENPQTFDEFDGLIKAAIRKASPKPTKAP